MSTPYTRPAYLSLLPNYYGHVPSSLTPFDGSDFASWCDAIKTVLQEYEVWELVTGQETEEEEGEGGRSRSFREATARRILLSGLSTRIKTAIVQQPVGAEMRRPSKLWEKLHECLELINLLNEENHILRQRLSQRESEIEKFHERQAAAAALHAERETQLVREAKLCHYREAAAVELFMNCATVDEICKAQREVAGWYEMEWVVVWEAMERKQRRFEVDF
ncbi:hypothetical protein FN846DRAFT_922199 [Sphaerosporella brunnea]|uniref:DUF4219 domain-containing protein n=1 Tax=Sphaerosporella brunnea TaxID=1250544 RepID=A0A5J5EKT7_9PEZI|nr:hypothetical protein FN846DRAFT_922199 [Sphaerosporella brunnea]